MHVGWRTRVASLLLASPLVVFCAIFAIDGAANDGGWGFIAENVALLLVLAVAVIAAGSLAARALGFRNTVVPPVSGSMLVLAAAFGLGAPVQLSWSDGCNGLGGVAPLVAAAPVLLGVADEPFSYVGYSTLMRCVPTPR